MKRVEILLISPVAIILVYCLSRSIYGGDGGELVTASFTNSIPHAPGFPLYTFLASLLIKIFPFSTPAWRVSLLSLIPAVFSRGFLLFLLIGLTNSIFISFCGILIYSFIYPVWLFSEVPEVVSLNILFFTILLYLTYKYLKDKKNSYLKFAFLIAGIAFFHNYVIVLAFPGIIYALYSTKSIKKIKSRIFYYLSLFAVGLLPYLYYVYLSSKYPVLDTEHPASLSGLFRLITRSSYGTFMLSKDIYFNLSSAIFNFLNLFNFIITDFKYFGVIFALFGIVYLYMKDRRVFHLFIINLISTILFFAYASFPLKIDYHLGTFEKYLPIPYLYISIFIVAGLTGIIEVLKKYLSHRLLKKYIPLILSISLLIYAAIIFRNNFQRIFVLKDDFTAENLGKDILASVPKNGIISLYDDTSYYNSLYVHYVLNIRPDIKFIKLGLLKEEYYQKNLKKNYPEIYLPDKNEPDNIFLKSFFEENSKKFSILNSAPNAVITEVWLPNGLLWKYHPSYKPLPKPDELILTNLKLWQNFNLPLSGSLEKYQSLLLSDVLRVYSQGHQSLGLLLHRNKQYELAENEFKEALNYNSKNIDNYFNLADLYIDLKKCKEAETILLKAKEINSKDSKLIKNMINLYGNCYNNPYKAEEYLNLYTE